jgi:hypothetical protein
MLIEAVLIVFANLPALPALAPHEFMLLDFWQSQPRSIEQTMRKNARPTAKCNAAAVAPSRSRIAVKYK